MPKPQSQTPYRSESDPRNVFEDEVPSDAREPRSSRGRGKSTTRADVKRERETWSPPSQPPEVSDLVWELSQQWIEMATAALGGQHPRVNQANFSRQLSLRINADQALRRWLRRKPEYWTRTFPGKWNDGSQFVNEVVHRMMQMFFEHLTEEQIANPRNLQFDFLRDEWDEWVYQAVTSIQVAWLKVHGQWKKSSLPTAVFEFNRHDLNAPDDDAPCTDPMFEGMTWGEVRAQARDDHDLLGPATDDALDEVSREKMSGTSEAFARLKSATLARRKAKKKRKTTTKETTNG